jgi:hypothetical protein
VIDDKAQQQLDEVGLTTYDIVLINQIIGFTGFQARVVAVSGLTGASRTLAAGASYPAPCANQWHAQAVGVHPARCRIALCQCPAVELLARWQAT